MSVYKQLHPFQKTANRCTPIDIVNERSCIPQMTNNISKICYILNF